MELFAGVIRVEYHQVYVYGDDVPQPGEEAFSHQRNGLCGAGAAGSLYLIAGLHTGRVNFAVRLESSEPPVEEHWEEVVEVPFATTSGRIAVVQWGGPLVHSMEVQPGTYRVRYSGRGLDVAHRELNPGCEPVDSYLLTFWPAPPAPDAIIKQSGELARYRHGQQALAQQRQGDTT